MMRRKEVSFCSGGLQAASSDRRTHRARRNLPSQKNDHNSRIFVGRGFSHDIGAARTSGFSR